jgi:hypothetical protein
MPIHDSKGIDSHPQSSYTRAMVNFQDDRVEPLIRKESTRMASNFPSLMRSREILQQPTTLNW